MLYSHTIKLVRYYEGADGLKTGHTDAAKYCLAATAKKNKMRLIAVVLGEEESKVRNSEAMALLDYGFNNKKMTTIKSKGEVVEEITFDKGNKDKISIVPKNDIGVLQDKNTDKHEYSYKVKLNDIELPIKKNDKIGEIKVYEKNKFITKGDLVSNTSVDKLNYLELYKETIKNSIMGIIN